MKPETSESGSEQEPGRRPVLPIFLKLFLLLNIIVLAGLFIWEFSGKIPGGEDASPKEHELGAVNLEKALEANPQISSDAHGRIVIEKYTIDATNRNKWVHFSFTNGVTHIEEFIDKDSLDWDIAFRRAKILSNGGATNPKGVVAIAALPGADFQSLDTLPPAEAFFVDTKISSTAEPKNPAIDKWYKFDFMTFGLEPKDTTYIIRLADGGHTKLKILDYYCGSTSACYTFKYSYQKIASTSQGGQ